MTAPLKTIESPDDLAGQSLGAPPCSAAWRASLKAAAARRDFPNLLFAEKWIRSILRAGLYPRWWGDDKGE